MYLINAMKSGALLAFIACLVLIISLYLHLAFGWEFEKTILMLSAGVCLTTALVILVQNG